MNTVPLFWLIVVSIIAAGLLVSTIVLAVKWHQSRNKNVSELEDTWSSYPMVRPNNKVTTYNLNVNPSGLFDMGDTKNVYGVHWSTYSSTEPETKSVFPVPGIVTKPGYQVIVNIRNNLPMQGSMMPMVMNTFHGLENFNIHPHGSHLSPCQDNIFLKVKPGTDKCTYTFDFPENHQLGQLMVHAHKHGAVADHINRGCAFPLIVEGEYDEFFNDVRTEICFISVHHLIKPSKEVKSQYPDAEYEILTIGELDNFITNVKNSTTIVLCNGKTNPTFTVDGNKPIRLRTAFCSAMQPGLIEFTDLNGDAVDVQITAVDSVALTTPQTVSKILYPQIGRVDIYIPKPPTGNVIYVKRPESSGDDAYNAFGMGYLSSGPAQIMTIKYKNVSTETSTIVSLPDTLKTGSLYSSVLTDKIFEGMWNKCKSDVKNSSTFEAANNAAKKIGFEQLRDIEFGGAPPLFTINGNAYQPDTISIRPKLNTMELWRVRSYHKGTASAMAHTLHIHTNQFLVLEGGEIEITGVENQIKRPVWRDVVFIPKASKGGEPGDYVYLGMVFNDYIGEIVLHCHFVDHEDLGMMANVEIVDDSQKNAVNVDCVVEKGYCLR